MADSEQPTPLDYAGPHSDDGWLAKPRPSVPRRIAHFAVATFIVLFLIAAFLPPLSHRHSSTTVRSLSNLRQIGVLLHLYQSQYRGRFPDSWETLIASSKDLKEATSVSELLAGSRDDIMPASGSTIRAITFDFSGGGHCAYIYMGNGLTSKTVGTRRIIAYEALPVASKRLQIPVLYSDGSTEVLQLHAAIAAIQKAVDQPATQPASSQKPVIP